MEKKGLTVCIVRSRLRRNTMRVSKGTDEDGHYMDLVREKVIYDILHNWSLASTSLNRLFERTYLSVHELHLCSTKQKQN